MSNSLNQPSAVLMGSKPGSVVALETLIARGWEIPAVVVSEGITHDWFDGPTLSEVARSNGIEVLVQSELKPTLTADFVISYMYRHLVKRPALELAKMAAVNFHAAPLPRFGGWAFYNVAILEDCQKYGVTCHYMDEGFDTGPLLKVKWFDVDCTKETAISLERKSQLQMAELFQEFVSLAESGEDLPIEAQNAEEMRYMNKSEFEKLKEIPTSASTYEADRIARAFWYPPYECAYVTTDNGRLEVVPNLAKSQIAALTQRGVYQELKEKLFQREAIKS